MAGDMEYDRMMANVDDFTLDSTMGLDSAGLGSQCHVCLKSFVSPKGLQQHSIVHTDRKPFVCEVCQKPFRFKSNLFEHRSIHTGEQPYICPFCNKACRLKGNLKKHLKTHIKEADEIDRAYEAVTGSGPMNSSGYRAGDSGDDSAYDGMIFSKSKRRKTINPRKITKAPTVGLVVTVGHDEDAEPYTRASINRPTVKELFKENHSLSEFLDELRNIPYTTHKCRLCRLEFPTMMDMKEHAESVHDVNKEGSERDEKERGNIWCCDCLLPFEDYKSYDRHMNFHQDFRSMIETGEFCLREPNPMAHR